MKMRGLHGRLIFFHGMRKLSKTVLTLTRGRVAFCNWNNTCKTELRVHTNPVWCNKVLTSPWWRHQMEAFYALQALCEENPPVNGGFPSQMPMMRGFGVSLICTGTNSWTNNRDAGDLRRYRAHYDITAMVVAGFTGPVFFCLRCS